MASASESRPLIVDGSRGSRSGSGPSRDMGLAREAYSKGDPELSRFAHDRGVAGAPKSTEEGHQQEGNLIKSVVFGGLDGILTTFAVVCGATGGGLGTEVILILGFAGKVSEALAMGLGDALSTKAEAEFIMKEREREYWEFDNYPEGEKDEMVELYVKRGMSVEDATRVIELMADHRDFFVDVMMVEELGLQVPDPDDNPWIGGFVTFCSFIFFGFFPLLGYCIFPFAFPELSDETLFAIACLLSGATLFVLGAIKSMFSVKPWWWSGTEMLLVGGAVCLVAYVIGATTKRFLGVDPNSLDSIGPQP